MSLSKKFAIVITICFCSLFCACSPDRYYARDYAKYIRNTRDHVKKNAEAEKLEPYQLQYELQNIDYQIMDSCEQLLYSITDTFTVTYIFEGNGVYEIVLISKDSSHYEVYSPKIKCSKGKKIKEGHTYKMTIVPYFKKKKGRSRPIEITRPVYIKGYRIIPYPLFFGQVYSINNLEGLYLLTDGM